MMNETKQYSMEKSEVISRKGTKYQVSTHITLSPISSPWTSPFPPSQAATHSHTLTPYAPNSSRPAHPPPHAQVSPVTPIHQVSSNTPKVVFPHPPLTSKTPKTQPATESPLPLPSTSASSSHQPESGQHQSQAPTSSATPANTKTRHSPHY